MTYLKDLSKFTYSGEDDIKALSVGWLSKEYEYTKGKLDLEVLEKIELLVSKPVNLYRGLHYCEYCPPPVFRKIENRMVSEEITGCPNGNGEIRILGSNNQVYVAPVLIAHYIRAHDYLPPVEFINAVAKCQ